MTDQPKRPPRDSQPLRVEGKDWKPTAKKWAEDPYLRLPYPKDPETGLPRVQRRDEAPRFDLYELGRLMAVLFFTAWHDGQQIGYVTLERQGHFAAGRDWLVGLLQMSPRDVQPWLDRMVRRDVFVLVRPHRNRHEPAIYAWTHYGYEVVRRQLAAAQRQIPHDAANPVRRGSPYHPEQFGTEPSPQQDGEFPENPQQVVRRGFDEGASEIAKTNGTDIGEESTAEEAEAPRGAALKGQLLALYHEWSHQDDDDQDAWLDLVAHAADDAQKAQAAHAALSAQVEAGTDFPFPDWVRGYLSDCLASQAGCHGR